MRTYGRTYDALGNATWIVVETDANGYDDAVYLTTLAQNIKLNLGESPFYANYGIPAYQSVLTQVFPDFYVWQIQAQFAPYFASLKIVKQPSTSTPSYTATAMLHNGAIFTLTTNSIPGSAVPGYAIPGTSANRTNREVPV